MKWITLYLTLLVTVALSNRVSYGISRFYEGCFAYFQYNYYGLEKEGYHKELTRSWKLMCKKEDYTPEMEAFLHSDMKRGKSKILSEKKRKEAFKVDVGNKAYVVKTHCQRGYFKNILLMGKAVSIWNNLVWATEKGLPVQEPIAWVEKRKSGKVITYLLYKYEGEGANYRILEDVTISHAIDNAVKLLEKSRVIHPDLRARNMIYLKEGEIKFIDVDILHYYPKFSLVYHKRMSEEKRLFKEDCPAYVANTQD